MISATPQGRGRVNVPLDANYRRARRPDDLDSSRALCTIVHASGCASPLLYVLLYRPDASLPGQIDRTLIDFRSLKAFASDWKVGGVGIDLSEAMLLFGKASLLSWWSGPGVRCNDVGADSWRC